jgi:hypothetical protein
MQRRGSQKPPESNHAFEIGFLRLDKADSQREGSTEEPKIKTSKKLMVRGRSND